jgi:hypothetical protein
VKSLFWTWAVPIVLALGGGHVACNSAMAGTGPETNRGMLVFSIDQGFPNGPVENDDLKVLQRQIDCLKPFSKKYDTYVLLAGDIANKGYLQDALDLLVKNQIAFFLGAASSDAIALDAGTAPYDRSHGLELSIDQLRMYKDRYRAHFRGIRLFELFAEHWTLWASKFHNENWADSYRQYWPTDDFYQTSLIEPYVKFAADNGMLVIFSDWFWYFDHQSVPAGVAQQQHESELKSLTRRFPNVVVVVYDNNEPNSHSKDVQWVPTFRQYRSGGAKGFGLSDQAWLCDNEVQCPADVLAWWAVNALQDGATLIETEPYWYWWDLPRGHGGKNDYSSYKTSEDRGKPAETLHKFASALGISTCERRN